MADPMRVRAMETGLRKDAAGKTVPAHFIQSVTVRHKEREVFLAQFGPSISKDPFLSFKFKGALKGDKVSVTWVDNTGDKRSDEATVA
jgi:sulfur-oxidizing protein SoxZ